MPAPLVTTLLVLGLVLATAGFGAVGVGAAVAAALLQIVVDAPSRVPPSDPA